MTVHTAEAGIPERVGQQCHDIQLPSRRGGSPVSLNEISKRFYTSLYGAYFNQQPFRYSFNYPMDRFDAMRFAGPDVHPIYHQLFLAEHYVPLVIAAHEKAGGKPLQAEDKALLHFVCRFHDIGESTHPWLKGDGFTPVGDIPYGEKTEIDRQHEAQILHGFFQEPPFTTIEQRFLRRAEAIIAHKPSTEFTQDTVLHELFELSHHIQAFDTAALATHAAGHAQHLMSVHTHTQLQRLGEVVTRVQRTTLERQFGASALTTIALNLARLPRHFTTLENAGFHQRCVPLTVLPLFRKPLEAQPAATK